MVAAARLRELVRTRWRAAVQLPRLGFVLRLAEGLSDHSAFLAASAMAFNFFLSFIPLLVMMGALLGHFVRAQGVSAFLGPLSQLAPFAHDIVRDELDRLAGTSATVAPLSIAGFLYLASTGAASLVSTFELALGTRRRSWWARRAIALGWVLGMMVALVLTLWACLAIDGWLFPGDITERLHVARPVWERWGLLTVLGAVVTAGLALLYRFAVVHPIGVVRRAWPGAFTAVLSTLVVSWAFGRYALTLGHYALFYGSAAAIATLLVWLYLTSLAVLLGAEVNAQLEGVRTRDSASRAAPPGQHARHEPEG